MILIIDGPEKAGKTTTIRILRDLMKEVGMAVNVRHWGPVTPDDREFSPLLREDIENDPMHTLTIWDRGWASEHVYANLLGRQRRLANDPWFGEWLHGRAAENKFILLTNPTLLQQRRDSSDLPVDPGEEYILFENYAERFQWTKIYTTPGDPMGDALDICLEMKWADYALLPPNYCGPRGAPVIFVGDEKESMTSVPGAWLPFSNKLMTMYGRALGDEALKCGWTNARRMPPPKVREAKCVVSCGATAKTWVDYYITHSGPSWSPEHIHLPHPSWVYKGGNGKPTDKVREAEKILTAIKDKYLKG